MCIDVHIHLIKKLVPLCPFRLLPISNRRLVIPQQFSTQHCSIKKYNHYCYVPTTVIVLSSLRRHSTKSLLARARRIQYFYLHLRSCSLPPSFFNTCSSGQSSPQSSIGSLSFSSSNSSSTQSPPSSHGSLADLSTSPTPFIRPQPRIQVASLLSDPRTR